MSHVVRISGQENAPPANKSTKRAAPASVHHKQWGAEKPRPPLPRQHLRPSDRTLTLGRVAIGATVCSWVAYLVTTVMQEVIGAEDPSYRQMGELVLYVAVVTVLSFSALMYLVARQAAMERFSHHLRLARGEIDRHFARGGQSMTVLVPSYREEPDIVRMTLWSALLQEMDELRVVLLVDDPPDSNDPVHAGNLARTKALVVEMGELLAAPRERFEASCARADGLSPTEALDAVIDDHRWAVAWLQQMAANESPVDHVGEFFVDQVILGSARDLTVVADALEAARAEGLTPDPRRLRQLRTRLTRLFSGEVTTFERKRFRSLSHEANKAMNLNAYIGLMGRDFVVEETEAGTVLRHCDSPVEGGFSVPRPEYVLTLDADSLLLPEYVVRLVHELERPGNDRIAVIQTPYSSYRGAPSRLERLAAATTDLQHVQHQGFTAHNATFWVGANAIIRRTALEDIEQIEVVEGVWIHRYVQDRTPIEDTESSVDLAARGWQLVNYPERLSYSATPPDFGSLVVQRRRWANGGLLILAKFWRQVRERRRRGEQISALEIALRVNYMASIGWASFGLLLLLFYPFDSRLLSPLVILTALPYACMMASDLRRAGYRRSDVVRIYGFNLILMPVNLGGVLKSLQQGVTGQKIPFARTPKVRNRTATPALYVLGPMAIIGFSAYTSLHAWSLEQWGSSIFAAVNCVLATWAFVSYLGVVAPVIDLFAAVVQWTVVPIKRRPDPVEDSGGDPSDWRRVLHYGTADPDSLPRTVVPQDFPALPLAEAVPRPRAEEGR